MNLSLSTYLSPIPLIAILRGIQSRECVDIARTIYDAGFRCIEIPLNSPDAIASIALLVEHLPKDCLIGAGTVMTPDQVTAVHQTGGRLIVMPHADTSVIRAAKALNMLCTPGVATLTEAFAALHAGADALKLFPSESVPPSVLKAWHSVLPASTICLPVGGVKPDGMQVYVDAGAQGFGLGSNLYKAGWNAEQVRANADAYVVAWRAFSGG
ncbi:2-dehydro-3-deoxy-6-phosphogalactonate aldolase [Undibacterium sp. Di24W]|uniref:2-dehydro-3-deoxy-6-phosphogalactonate aldolase n=1 Tax=Undibacterium sp. Di24W TaxID=3413033 RepID=UPI003BF3E4F9